VNCFTLLKLLDGSIIIIIYFIALLLKTPK
jgi:hypothetical protein